jgi:ribonuclease G
LAEWLYEAGIGEARAALIEDGRILKARIELDSEGPQPGAVVGARLTDKVARIAALDVGGEAFLQLLPPGLTQGGALTVEIIRAAIPEPGRAKRPVAIVSALAPREAPGLLARIAAGSHPARQLRAHEADALEEAGWSEVLEEARTGEIAFTGGALRMSPTPAMTLFDVDGIGPVETLAGAAATAVAEAIVRHDIGGSIGIDFPTLSGKAARQAVADAIDAALPQPFERTALNGFGFLQIVRRRSRASLPELLRADPAAADARALLRSIERTPPGGPTRHAVSAAVHAALERRPGWVTELVRRTGATHIFEVR